MGMVEKKPEYVEGKKAYQNVYKAMDSLMKVSHDEIKAKLEA